MPPTEPTTPMTTSGPNRFPWALVGIAVVALAILGAAGLWYLFFRPAGPPPVSLATLPPTATVASPAATAHASDDPSAEGSSTPATSSDGGSAAGGIDGTWSIDPSIGSFSDFSGSFVGYRVNEQLATIGAQEAVGRTPDVTGTLTIQGTTLTAADITADLTTLQSDEANRDRQLSRQALETSTYPTATFQLTQPIDLGSIPEGGQTIDVSATGNMTLHGVTKEVQVPLQARLDGNVISVAGSLPILFSDYGIQQPRSMIVLSVEDHGTLELQLHFTRS